MAAGFFPDLGQAAEAMVAIERVVEPNPAFQAVYDALFERYMTLYQILNTPA